MGTATVEIAHAALSANVWATWLINSGGISGSSPCTFTIKVSAGSFSSWATSAMRSVPVGWSALVNKHSIRCSSHAAWISAESVATTTLWALDCCARSATRITMGLPPISAKGLRGRRVEPSLAGITTKNSGGLEALLLIGWLALDQYLVDFIGRHAAGFINEHDGDVIANRVG